MAKGSRGGKRGGTSAKGELVLPNGSKIEFEGELQFDGNDAAVSGNVRTVITNWESKRVKNKVEYGYAVTADGTPIGAEVRGTKNSVSVPRYYQDTPDAIFTHNHPRGDGMLGGTFSDADLRNFANCSNKTVRAATKEGTYSISKTSKFDVTGFNSFVAKCEGEFNRRCRESGDKHADDYYKGKITYEQYTKAVAKSFNTALVKMHNDYRKGQKQYGYTYTLEKNE